MLEGINILIVEDNKNIIEGLEYVLKKEGFSIIIAKNKQEAMSYIKSDEFDLFLVDVQLPDGTGFEICKYLKDKYDVPVILTSAIGEEANVVYGLDLGADDFIVKPFRNSELIARINCVLRREGRCANKNIIKYRNILVDVQKAKVTTEEGEDIFFSSLEYKLLLLFLKNKNKILSRRKILEKIWDVNGNYVNDNTLSVYIRRLRDKLTNKTDNETIKTIRGIGYMLND